jgi:hypothetical protein
MAEYSPWRGVDSREPRTTPDHVSLAPFCELVWGLGACSVARSALGSFLYNCIAHFLTHPWLFAIQN